MATSLRASQGCGFADLPERQSVARERCAPDGPNPDRGIMRVGDIAAGRAGDKGDILDLSLVARDQAAYEALC